MTKPTKSSTSGKAGDKPADKAEAQKTTPETKPETLKLKKEAAKPDSIASKDIGTGNGAEAAAGGGKVSPAESSLVGKSTGGLSAAVAKASAGEYSGGKATDSKPADVKPADSKTVDSKAADIKAAESKSAFSAPENTTASTASKATDTRSTDTTKDKSASPSQAQHAVVQKTGFWPVVAGGVIAAGLGAAATIWALPHLPAGWLPEDQAQETAIDAEAIKAEAVAAAEEAARKVAADAAPANAGASEDIQAALASQEERIAAVEKAVEEAGSAGTGSAGAGSASLAATTEEPATPPAPVTDGNLQQVVEQLQKQLETQAAQIDELAARPTLDPEEAKKVQELAGRVDAVQQEISAAQEETAKLQAAAQESTKRAQAVAAIASLQAALEKGVTPEKAQQKLAEAGIDAPEALAKEVPSLESLQAGFGDASRAALRASRSGQNTNGNLLTNFLRSQTGARSVEPREGNDPDAILSRANASVENGDIAAALEEMAALPDAAKAAPAMAEWLSGANAYRDAAAALSDLSATNN